MILYIQYNRLLSRQKQKQNINDGSVLFRCLVSATVSQSKTEFSHCLFCYFHVFPTVSGLTVHVKAITVFYALVNHLHWTIMNHLIPLTWRTVRPYSGNQKELESHFLTDSAKISSCQRENCNQINQFIFWLTITYSLKPWVEGKNRDNGHSRSNGRVKNWDSSRISSSSILTWVTEEGKKDPR